MKPLTLCLCLLLLIVFAQPAAPQKNRVTWPEPPQPADAWAVSPHFPAATPGTTPKPRVDSLQLQRDAKELLELSQSVQPDIDSVNHGLLPKDTLEKLKRIEKLSKHLRSQLAP